MSPNDQVKDINIKCDICSFNAGTKNTLRKYINTKHPESKLDRVVLKDRSEGDPECSMCQDKFTTSKELNSHIEEHLKEIEDIDVEYLKSGHDEFECSQCEFKSNDDEGVKDHLTSHAMKSYVKAKPRKTRKEMELIKKAGSFRDLYDDEGDPLYDTTDSESDDSKI